MVKAILLLNVTVGKEQQIAQALRENNSVIEAMVTFGDFDVCAIVSAENAKELGRLVTLEIRKIDGVMKTSTLLEADKY